MQTILGKVFKLSEYDLYYNKNATKTYKQKHNCLNYLSHPIKYNIIIYNVFISTIK